MKKKKNVDNLKRERERRMKCKDKNGFIELRRRKWKDI